MIKDITITGVKYPDGTLTVPEVLRPYMNGRDVI